MKWSFATVGLIVLGLIGVAVILLFQQITTNNENDYYLLKEVTEAAMIDAIDIPYYRETGNLKIVTEKFVENFTRRFAESTIFVTNDYRINFYDIIETPPKVSIMIDTGLGQITIAGNSDDYNIANKLDAILEYTGKNTDVSVTSPAYGRPYVSKSKNIEYYALFSKRYGSGSFDEYLSLKLPGELSGPNIRNVKINSVSFVSEVNSQGDLNEALLRRDLFYNDSALDDSLYTLSIRSYATNVSNVRFERYNCGMSTSRYNCNDTDKYWIHVSGNTSDSSYEYVIFKYKINWSYEEYEYE